jgi:hypothetical protein
MLPNQVPLLAPRRAKVGSTRPGPSNSGWREHGRDLLVPELGQHPEHLDMCSLTDAICEAGKPLPIGVIRVIGDHRALRAGITLDTPVIIAGIFGPICGDDHPCITRSDFPKKYGKGSVAIAYLIERA